jgi:FkbM family methyltransferase
MGEFHNFVEEYEPLTTRAAESLINGGVAVDVGASIGIHTIHFAKKAKLVIAIEPYPEYLKLLMRNIMANHVNNVIVVPAAVSNQNGIARLYKSGHMWTLQENELCSGERRSDSITVVTLTLKTILRKYGIRHVDLLKVDVEGAECLVLEGLGEYLLPQKVNALIVEVNKRNEEKVRMLCKEYRHIVKLEEYPWNTNYLIQA